MLEYRTVTDAQGEEYVEKRSRFLPTIRRVESETACAALLNELRERHPDARHHCWAYILRPGHVQRYSDDGEPQGSAGMPILEVLRREGLMDAMIVVTRYFGGTLLGAAGLLRVYTHAAKNAVDAAELLEMRAHTVLTLRTPYTLYGKLENLLAAAGAETLESDFGAEVSLTLRLRSDRLPALERQLAELSAGAVSPQVLREESAPVSACD